MFAMRGWFLSIATGIAIGSCAGGPIGPAAADTPSSVPCAVYGAPKVATCFSPFQQGVVDGQWIGIIAHYNGTNGGADSMRIVSIGAGGNGEETIPVGVFAPSGTGGDRMVAVFTGGKLWLKNAVYLNGEAHCCFTHVAVRQYGFHGGKLQQEREVTVAADASDATIRAALASSSR
jgi:hypothetical protein